MQTDTPVETTVNTSALKTFLSRRPSKKTVALALTGAAAVSLAVLAKDAVSVNVETESDVVES